MAGVKLERLKPQFYAERFSTSFGFDDWTSWRQRAAAISVT